MARVTAREREVRDGKRVVGKVSTSYGSAFTTVGKPLEISPEDGFWRALGKTAVNRFRRERKIRTGTTVTVQGEVITTPATRRNGPTTEPVSTWQQTLSVNPTRREVAKVRAVEEETADSIRHHPNRHTTKST